MGSAWVDTKLPEIDGMTQDEWTTRFAASLVEASDKTKDAAATIARNFFPAYGKSAPDDVAYYLVSVWDDEEKEERDHAVT